MINLYLPARSLIISFNPRTKTNSNISDFLHIMKKKKIINFFYQQSFRGFQAKLFHTQVDKTLCQIKNMPMKNKEKLQE